MTGTKGSINSTQMIFAGSGQWFSPANLASFQAWANAPVIPAVALIGGHVNDSKCLVHSNCAEANLDMQYITTMPPYSPTTFWYTDEWFTTFMIAVLNTAKPPKVISMSYGAYETGMPAGIHSSFDIEAIKLDIQGTTIFAASGDDGVHDPQASADRRKCRYAVRVHFSSLLEAQLYVYEYSDTYLLYSCH